MKKTVLFFIVMVMMAKVHAQDIRLKVGHPAPEIELLTVKNEPFSLSSLKGKVVLIDFWATWCAPCVKEQPELKKLYSRLEKQVKAGRFEILGVSLDRSKDNWTKTIDRFQIKWIQVSDLKFWKSPVAKAYGIEELPFNVIIDEHGKIIAMNLHGKELEEFIIRYFKGKK